MSDCEDTGDGGDDGGGIRAGIASRAETAQKHVQGLVDVSGTLLGVWDRIIGTSDRLQNQVARVDDSVNRVAGSLAETMVPAFRTAADVVVRASELFRRLPGPMRAFVAMTLGIATALAVVVPAAATAASALASVSLPVLALIALGAALYAAWQYNLFGIREIATQVLGWLRQQFARVVAFVRPLWQRFVAGLRKLWSVHGSALASEGGQTLSTLLTAFKEFVAFTRPLWETYLTALAASAKIVWALVKTYVLTYLDAIVSGVRIAMALLRGDWETAWDIFVGFVQRTGERLQSLADRIESILGGLAEPAIQWAKDMLGKFIEGVNAKFEALKTRIQEVKQAIVDRLSALPSEALSWGEDLVQQFIAGIRNKIGELESAVSDVESTVEGAMSFDIAANDRMARRWGSDLVQEFSHGMGRNLGTLDRASPASEPGAFGLPQPQPTSGAGTAIDVTVEAGAVQLNGRGTGRLNAERTAEGIGEEMADRFGRR